MTALRHLSSGVVLGAAAVCHGAAVALMRLFRRLRPADRKETSREAE